MKLYLKFTSVRSTKIKLEVVMDVVVDEVVDKEVTKVKKLVQEVNEGLVLVCRCGDGRRGLKVHMVTTYWRLEKGLLRFD